MDLNIKTLFELEKLAHDITNKILDLQKEKIKAIADFLEYEEAMTTDKETAIRIRKILIVLNVWEEDSSPIKTEEYGT